MLFLTTLIVLIGSIFCMTDESRVCFFKIFDGRRVLSKSEMLNLAACTRRGLDSRYEMDREVEKQLVEFEAMEWPEVDEVLTTTIVPLPSEKTDNLSLELGLEVKVLLNEIRSLRQEIKVLNIFFGIFSTFMLHMVISWLWNQYKALKVKRRDCHSMPNSV